MSAPGTTCPLADAPGSVPDYADPWRVRSSGREESARASAETGSRLRIHSCARSRSCSGRAMTNAAASRPSSSHQTLKLAPVGLPRVTMRSAAEESPQNS